MKKRLSYDICPDMPGWPGNPTYSVETFSSIDQGDVANTSIIHLFAHFGSHMDAPNHFIKQGIPIKEVPFDRFFFERPFILDIKKDAGEKISKEDIVPYADELSCCDLLMFRTGFSRFRTDDPEMYMKHSPAIGSKAAKYLIDNYGSTLKAVAVDFLSLASFSDGEDGNLAHRYILGEWSDEYICIIEDIHMDELDNEGLLSVTAMPLFLDGSDSSPVTVWADIAE